MKECLFYFFISNGKIMSRTNKARCQILCSLLTFISRNPLYMRLAGGGKKHKKVENKKSIYQYIPMHKTMQAIFSQYKKYLP